MTRALVGSLLALAVAGGTARAQAVPAPTRPATAEEAILRALAENPATAPYAISTSRKAGRVVLAGRVGTREVHDVAIRLALDVTPSIDDRLVIDTAEVYRAANRAAALAPAPQAGAYAPNPAPYVYPPPLFGRLDDPFYGFEPPIISYPPWWGAVANRRGDPYGAPALDPDSPIGPDPGPPRVGARPTDPDPGSPGPGPSVEMTIDPLGTAVLRGVVPSDEISRAIALKAERVPGVARVVNRLEVRPDAEEPAEPIRPRDVPPPPPVPDMPGPAPAPAPAPNPGPETPAANPIVPADSADARLTRALAQRPALEGSGAKAEVRDGVATLTGKVPTAYEAMLAFRAAQQTVGVQSIVDRLEFQVPDGLKPNPLITRGRPDDVEPYLEAQLRRQLVDQAQIDRVRLVGDRLDVRGTIRKADDRTRVEAILRSMPLLRGFTLDLNLVPE